MARPPRFNATYYTHDAGLRNDRKVKAIRTKFGAAGYGLFHMLLEALTDADHTALDTSGLELELLAGDFGVEAADIEALLKFGEGVGYFGRNEAGLLVCAELSKWLEPVFEKRNRSKNPPAAALLPQPAAETGVSVTETPQSKGKKSKEEESKEEDNSSLRSEPAADAAAPAEKKIEEAEALGESPAPKKPPVAKPPRRPVLAGPLAQLLNVGGAAHEVQALKNPLTQTEADALVAEYGIGPAAQIVQEMANYAKLRNYTSVNLTARNWLKKRTDEPRPQHPAPAGVAGHGQRLAPSVHANPFGLASAASLAIATAVAVGGQRGNGIE